MSSKLLPSLFVLAAILFSIADIVVHYRELPAQMASHFNAAGIPDGWSSKAEFVTLSLVVLGAVAAALVLMTLVARYAPSSLINVPNKQYWLAPEREAETRQAIVDWSTWLIAATMWLFALIFHDVTRANLRQPPQLESVWWLFGGYVAVVVILLTQLFTRFRRAP